MMKLVKDTELGPLTLCEGCFLSYAAYHHLKPEDFEDITGKVRPFHPCDICGETAAEEQKKETGTVVEDRK